ncbi:hypothetical protein MPTK1_4g12070 [Marchantia polymorpha subsp. ruderalis]|uniref:Uncharacterized protein n=2 Tax=Marchantia polymorpha TaxID=3197 RepID=A0AAF6B914_MARPO|nr:hypothetical protein MARPO_0011s0189 [Marchantia polymorpha]BBN08498.1 hypothetical protein Mp_4g12070 [Marchantia polymorpha subsp. ruderalis]|eukprot:PTQ46532.1 hypothetical protein MARPO_0011s0189 [Marchantia polymorpha]
MHAIGSPSLSGKGDMDIRRFGQCKSASIIRLDMDIPLEFPLPVLSMKPAGMAVAGRKGGLPFGQLSLGCGSGPCVQISSHQPRCFAPMSRGRCFLSDSCLTEWIHTKGRPTPLGTKV